MTTKTKTVAVAYGSHKAGSRKGKVHQAFDAKGRDAARALGAKLGLAPATVMSWMSGWGGKPAKAAAKKAVATKRSRK